MPDFESTSEERKLASALVHAGIPINTAKKFPYTSSAGERKYIKPDICIPALKLVIEVDGEHHTGTAQQSRSDRLRAATCMRAGYTVQHVSNKLVNNPEEFQKLVQGLKISYAQSKLHPKQSTIQTPPTTKHDPQPTTKKESTDDEGLVLDFSRKTAWWLKITAPIVLPLSMLISGITRDAAAFYLCTWFFIIWFFYYKAAHKKLRKILYYVGWLYWPVTILGATL